MAWEGTCAADERCLNIKVRNEEETDGNNWAL
jgi:hypothetical protein